MNLLMMTNYVYLIVGVWRGRRWVIVNIVALSFCMHCVSGVLSEAAWMRERRKPKEMVVELPGVVVVGEVNNKLVITSEDLRSPFQYWLSLLSRRKRHRLEFSDSDYYRTVLEWESEIESEENVGQMWLLMFRSFFTLWLCIQTGTEKITRSRRDCAKCYYHPDLFMSLDSLQKEYYISVLGFGKRISWSRNQIQK